MNEGHDKYVDLLQRLGKIEKQHKALNEEIELLRKEVGLYGKGMEKGPKPKYEGEEAKTDIEVEELREMIRGYATSTPLPTKTIVNEEKQGQTMKSKASFKLAPNIEKFIGENLINKIGIVIIVIGVGIGTKYAIDHDLINPLTRIVMGYAFGLALLFVAIRLKAKYDNYSSVLLSGAMAIMYFVTFVAYDFYGLVPVYLAFSLMVLFTSFTVTAAIMYNKQVIAHIGLVGAYAVPFLLSNNSGRVEVLFSYMAIINIGILAISFKRYWKGLYYSAFSITWLVYNAWYTTNFKVGDSTLAFIFLCVFFVIFYGTFLSYKLIKEEKFEYLDIFLLLVNSFVFFGIGYSIFQQHPVGGKYLGLFTLFNAIVHFVVSRIIYRKKLADKNLFYMVLGMVMVFITIAVPVQLNGNWVTLMWSAEVVLLFWIGRTKGVLAYEYISYPVMFLAVVSLADDWQNIGGFSYSEEGVRPVFNVTFLTGLLVAAAFYFIFRIQSNKAYLSPFAATNTYNSIFSLLVLSVVAGVLYNSIRLQIVQYWDMKYGASLLSLSNSDGQGADGTLYNESLRYFKDIWVVNFTLMFLAVASFLNIWKLKEKLLGYINFGFNLLVIFIFLTFGLTVLTELREAYVSRSMSGYYNVGIYNVAIRYICYMFVVPLVHTCYLYVKSGIVEVKNKTWLGVVFHIFLFWVFTSELINIIDLVQAYPTYKLEVSLFFGVYSLALVSYGIWKRIKYVRIMAIVIFGVALAKVFFYDISHLNTISKTIVFVSLGVLLLIISFLYNKFKAKLFEDDGQ